MFDTRRTMYELKLALAEIFDIELDKFIIKKGGRMGIELKDLQKELNNYGFSKSGIVFLEFGTPINPGEMKLRVLRTVYKGEIMFQHDLLPVAEIAVDQTCTPSEAIEKAKLVALQESELDLSQMHFRLRDKRSRSLTKCFRDKAIRK